MNTHDEKTDDKTNTFDEVKGRVEQAAGDLTDDQDLKDEGTVDRVVSDVKDRVDQVGDKIKDLLTSDAKS